MLEYGSFIAAGAVAAFTGGYLWWTHKAIDITTTQRVAAEAAMVKNHALFVYHDEWHGTWSQHFDHVFTRRNPWSIYSPALLDFLHKHGVIGGSTYVDARAISVEAEKALYTKRQQDYEDYITGKTDEFPSSKRGLRSDTDIFPHV